MLVQAAESAGLPQNALLTGMVDAALPAAEIPRELLAYARQLTPPGRQERALRQERIMDILPAVGAILHERTGCEVGRYKPMTLVRRIERRMLLHHLPEPSAYLNLLGEDMQEAHILLKEFLIHVTSFFRDPEAFESLRRLVLPGLFGSKPQGEAVRVWVSACATGEEAYSLAILMCEYMEAAGVSRPVQIFATDLDAEVISRARTGLYSAPAVEEIAPERLQKYFRRIRGNYQVVDRIREMVIFSTHNLLKDPPFSRLDLISCRNVLIYLDKRTQERLLARFHHYALAPDGILFLGPSEGGIDGQRDLFESLDRKWKIFRRRPTSVPTQRGESLEAGNIPSAESIEAAGDESLSLAALGERALLQRYSPPSLIVNSRFEILHTFARVASFLDPPDGEWSTDLLKMVRRELRPVLRALLYQVFSEQRPCRYEGVKIGEGEGAKFIDVAVSLLEPAGREQALVSFEEAGPPQEEGPEAGLTCDSLVWQLEDQLRTVTDQLYAHLSQSERSEEALKASNEELISMNEELQSTNEEMEASKEKLQTLTEELEMVNAELQKNLEELSQANDDVQNLTNSSRVPTLFLDKELYLKRFTPAAADLFDLKPGHAGRSIHPLIDKLDYSELKEDARLVLRDLKIVKREIRDRGGRYYLARVLPYRTKEDVIGGVVLTFTDITSGKEADQALQQSEERLRLTTDAARIGTWDWDLVTDQLKFDERCKALFGVPPEAPFSYNLFLQALHPEDRERVDQAVQHACHPASDGRHEMEYRSIWPDGSVRWLYARGQTYFEGEGDRRRPVRFSGILMDLTERKRMEDDLRQAKEAAEEASRAKSEFLANMSHEIRTPITVVMSSLEMLSHEAADPQAQQILQMASSSAERLLTVINDILDFSRIEARKLEIHEEPFELRACVDKVLQLFSLKVQEKRLELICSIDQSIPDLVWGDPDRLGQILVNLVANSVKFTAEGKIIIRVQKIGSGDWVWIAVEDTGIGIPAEKMDLLFQSFSQVESSRTRRFGGTGLGLAVSKGLVELMGGSISVESEAGKGSIFSFVLPLRPAEESLAPAESPEMKTAEPPPRQARILLVEDDQMVRDLVEMFLRHRHYEVTAVEDGREALDVWAPEKFDLVLMDVQMPRVDGLEATRLIRQQEEGNHPPTPIVGLTAHARREDYEQCRNSGMDECLTKPISRGRLYEAIEEQLSRKS